MGVLLIYRLKKAMRDTISVPSGPDISVNASVFRTNVYSIFQNGRRGVYASVGPRLPNEFAVCRVYSVKIAVFTAGEDDVISNDRCRIDLVGQSEFGLLQAVCPVERLYPSVLEAYVHTVIGNDRRRVYKLVLKVLSP